MIAEEDVLVVDEHGIGRKLKAGQPVPARLLSAYSDAIGVEAEKDTETDEPVKPKRHAQPARRRKQ